MLVVSEGDLAFTLPCGPISRDQEEVSVRKPSREPEEERLSFFAGDWQDSGQALPGPFGPGGATHGRTTYRWQVGGKWLVYASHMAIPGMVTYEVHGGVTFNNQTGRYDAFAANSLGNLIVYEGVWTDRTTLVFTRTHPPPVGRSRIVYHVLDDGAIHMSSERVTEGGGYEAYFQTKMIRVHGKASGDGVLRAQLEKECSNPGAFPLP